MVKDHSDSEKGNPWRHIGYSYRLTPRVLLYAPSHRQDNTYHGLCYTSRGALAGTRNSSKGPPHERPIRRPIAPWANALTTELRLAPCLCLKCYLLNYDQVAHSDRRAWYAGYSVTWQFLDLLRVGLFVAAVSSVVVQCLPTHRHKYHKALQRINGRWRDHKIKTSLSRNHGPLNVRVKVFLLKVTSAKFSIGSVSRPLGQLRSVQFKFPQEMISLLHLTSKIGLLFLV